MRKTFLATALVLAMGAGQARASLITTPGDYQFTSGTVTGTFTSTGSGLSKWSFRAGQFGILFEDTNPVQGEFSNTAQLFGFGQLFGEPIFLNWETGTQTYRRQGCFVLGDPFICTVNDSFTVARTTVNPDPDPDPDPAPEPGTLALLAAGLASAGLARRRRA